jgi:membrane-associated phospholipid phosphatase
MGGLLFTAPGRAWDREWTRSAVAADQASPALHAFMRLGTEVGKARPVLVGLFLPAAFGTEIARGTARVAFVGLLGNQLAVEGVKRLTRRVRPDGEADPNNASFPSSHAAAGAGLAWVVAARHRGLAPWMWLAAVWIAASRVFLGRHFPSDVLAGALVGIWFAALALRYQDRLAAPRRVR